jgi:hypothetical protein
MGATHEEQLELRQELEAAKKTIKIGSLYRHYKGSDKIYKVISLGFLESNLEICVIYQAQYDEKLTFIRPLSIWLEKVVWKNVTVPRFSEIKS